MLSSASAVTLAVLALSVSSLPFKDEEELPLDDVLYYNDIDDDRSANEDPLSRWPEGEVPIVKDPRFSAEELNNITQGMELITSTTCMKFTQAYTSHKNYIQIVRGDPNGNCATDYVGRSKYQATSVTLKPNSYCMRPGTIAHELLHVAGLYHQMTRPDRDEYVDVLWENMDDDKSTRYQYQIQNKSLTYGVPYDYGSILHYPAGAGSKNGKPVMVKKKASEAVMGQREKLSENDIAIIKAMYCPNAGK